MTQNTPPVLDLQADLLKGIDAQSHGDVYYNLGIQLNGQGRPEEAVICYRKAVDLNPGDIDAYYNMGVALNALDKPEEAIKCYKKVLEINPRVGVNKVPLAQSCSPPLNPLPPGGKMVFFKNICARRHSSDITRRNV